MESLKDLKHLSIIITNIWSITLEMCWQALYSWSVRLNVLKQLMSSAKYSYIGAKTIIQFETKILVLKYIGKKDIGWLLYVEGGAHKYGLIAEFHRSNSCNTPSILRFAILSSVVYYSMSKLKYIPLNYMMTIWSST